MRYTNLVVQTVYNWLVA